MHKISVVIPNWNGEDTIKDCLFSLSKQSLSHEVIVVDNGSKDGSLNVIKQFKNIRVISNPKNYGFAGGVNIGMEYAIKNDSEFVASLNNDAVVKSTWLEHLYKCLVSNREIGIATSKIVSSRKDYLDSTGEFYTVWGLPFARGREETELSRYDKQTNIFAASGGASLYRSSMLREVGLFDEKFFAYYEDVDLSYRAQLAGWKVAYVPSAVAYHQIGATSSKIRGFTTYQTLKNLPQLLVKNVPRKYFFKISMRYLVAHVLFYFRAIVRGNGWSATKGSFSALFLLPLTLSKRKTIQKNKKVSDEYIWSMIIHDLPPNASSLRKFRNIWWDIRGKHG